MDKIRERLLLLLRSALDGSTLTELADTTAEEWNQIFRLASVHHVMPLIYETGYRIPAVRSGNIPAFLSARKQIFYQVMQQVQKTNDFLQLYRHLQEAGVTPLVTKGIICRNLYPQPDHRPSGDEDVLIDPEQFDLCHKALLDFGMTTTEPEEKLRTSYEVPYRKPGSSLYIELHKYLFSPESEAYGSWNRFFEDVLKRSVQEDFYGTGVHTFGYTDHFFYLILHSFKHFLHSGFGIRQVCDIVLYANRYGSQIDWALVLERCREVRAERFTAALLKIGEKYLVFDPEKACYPAFWQKISVDEAAMLEDLLSGGVYGDVSLSRRHSSNITLDAVAASNLGKKSKASPLSSLFPPAKDLESRFPWLKERHWLLPAAWLLRIVRYSRETRKVSGSSAAAAMRIGKERVALMKEYGIID